VMSVVVMHGDFDAAFVVEPTTPSISSELLLLLFEAVAVFILVVVVVRRFFLSFFSVAFRV
jgi:hypothetical protein